MIETVDLRLRNWAVWRIRRHDPGGLGFPKESIIVQRALYGCRIQTGQRPDSGPDISDWDCRQERVERAIEQLPEELQRVIAARYLAPGKEADKPRILNITASAYRQRCRDALLWLAGWFSCEQKAP